MHRTRIIPTIPTVEQLTNLAEKYSANFSPRQAPLRQHSGRGDVILITGTTRGFGCDVLEHLLREPTIQRVYAFNRLGSRAMERQRVSFRQRGLQEALLDSPKFVMVEAELHVPGFGIAPGLLEEIRQSVTHIMQNAWRVDFVAPLSSFANDLQAIRNFIELALSSPHIEPPTLQFVSSVIALDRYADLIPAPEGPVNPASALGGGYHEAKWVAERILYNASERAGVPTVVVRLGQVCGDRFGLWNEKEWFPALVKSALFIHCLPDMDGSVSFIPSYDAARALVEMRSPPGPVQRTLHLVHPHRVAWHTLIRAIADELGAALVSPAEWLSTLERTVHSLPAADRKALRRQNPALGLLDFYRARRVGERWEAFGCVYVATERAEAASETLRRLPALDADTARRWVAVWRASGFLPQKAAEYRL